MKKHILMAALLLFTIACSQNKNSSTTQNQADTITYETASFYKSSTECNTNTCGAYVKATYPVFKDDALNSFVMGKITIKPFDSVSYNALDIAADSFINEYVNFKKEYPETAGGYEWIQNLKVSYQNAKTINFTHSSYGYTGGAHGLENTLYYNLAKPSYTQLSLKDLFKAGYETELAKIAEQIFRSNEKLSEEDSLSDGYFFDDGKFSLTSNFLITKDGILFTYNPYEIKAYAYGSTDLLIPYQQIQHLIKSDSILAEHIQ